MEYLIYLITILIISEASLSEVRLYFCLIWSQYWLTYQKWHLWFSRCCSQFLILVIYQGSEWGSLWSLVRIELGRKMRVALKTKGTVFPIQTNLDRWITFFSASLLSLLCCVLCFAAFFALLRSLLCCEWRGNSRPWSVLWKVGFFSSARLANKFRGLKIPARKDA